MKEASDVGKGALVVMVVAGAMHAALQAAIAETPRATGAAAHVSASGRASSTHSLTASAPLTSGGANAITSGAFSGVRSVATAAGWGGDRQPSSDLVRLTAPEAAGVVIVVSPASAIAALERLAEAAQSAASARAAAIFDQPARVRRGIGSFPE